MLAFSRLSVKGVSFTNGTQNAKSEGECVVGASLLHYSCYAWGAPFVLTIITATTYFIPGTAEIISEEIRHCWFKGKNLILQF